MLRSRTVRQAPWAVEVRGKGGEQAPLPQGSSNPQACPLSGHLSTLESPNCGRQSLGLQGGALRPGGFPRASGPYSLARTAPLGDCVRRLAQARCLQGQGNRAEGAAGSLGWQGPKCGQARSVALAASHRPCACKAPRAGADKVTSALSDFCLHVGLYCF